MKIAMEQSNLTTLQSSMMSANTQISLVDKRNQNKYTWSSWDYGRHRLLMELLPLMSFATISEMFLLQSIEMTTSHLWCKIHGKSKF